jgi:hypothetical protein
MRRSVRRNRRRKKPGPRPQFDSHRVSSSPFGRAWPAWHSVPESRNAACHERGRPERIAMPVRPWREGTSQTREPPCASTPGSGCRPFGGGGLPGTCDPLAPYRFAVEAASRIAGAKLVAIQGGGHFFMGHDARSEPRSPRSSKGRPEPCHRRAQDPIVGGRPENHHATITGRLAWPVTSRTLGGGHRHLRTLDSTVSPQSGGNHLR